MEAHRIVVTPQTLDLNQLNKKKKTALRRKTIVEYIQSKPAGEIIRMAALQKIGQFSTTANANAFVNRMLRDGVIARYKGDRPRSYYYTVLGTVRVKKPEAPLELKKDGYVVPRPPVKDLGLTDYAKQFAWETNSDSLREFVQYMDGKELDLRRLADA